MVLTSSVAVAGTASGSHAEWAHGGAADFATGTHDRTVVNGIDLQLDHRFLDTFDDNSFDTAAWEKFDTGGLVTREENGGLHQVGTSTASSNWAARTIVLSKDPVGDSIEAYLGGCVGTGTGYNSIIVLFQDDSNQAGIGIIKDSARGWDNPTVYWGCINKGAQTNGVLTGIVGVAHRFSVTHTGGRVDLWVDGTVVKTFTMTLTAPRAKFGSTVLYNGDRIDAIWDDFKADFSASGTYVSGVHDTRAVDPVLTRAEWNASLPSGTSVGIEVRSSDTADMGNSTTWAKLTKGQSSGLPAARRYLQYRATLTSPGGVTPSLKDVTVSYAKPVKWVDVSLDQVNWTRASGREAWSAVVSVPDGPVTIWVRATDVAGDTRTTSVTFDVDTTWPLGSVVINGGDAMTSSRTVTLALSASDRYGVAEMMVSETPTFVDAMWAPFEPTRTLTLTSGDGARNVYARFRDRNGWTSATANDSILLDTTPPWGSIHIDDDAEYTNDTWVELALDAGDMSGVAEMRVGDAPDLSSQPWRPFSKNLSWQLPAGDGIKAVHAAFRDPLGHESVVVNDTIVLDTTAPVAHVTIDGGAIYTNQTEIDLGVTFDEANAVAAMQVGEDPLLALSLWEAPGTPRPFTLTSGDGERTVHVRARDAAGNVGEAAWDTIVLDMTAPTVLLGELPRKSPTPSFNVTWTGSDATSGVASHDAQYRIGDGPWTDWFTGTNVTQATFAGTDGHTYTFRARAHDIAGNIADYATSDPVRVLVPVAVVTVDEPVPQASVQGKVTVKGTSSHTDPEIGVRNVSVSVDGGPWEQAIGTTAWTFELDTELLEDGAHVLRARAFDGERYSQEATLTLTVDNPEPRAPISGWLLIILIVAIVAATIAVYVWKRSRRG